MNSHTAHTPLARYAAWRRRCLLLPYFALASFSVLAGVAWVFVLLPIRIDLTLPEAAEALRACAIARGEPAYVDWHAWPHIFTVYSPAFYYLPGWTLRLLHIVPTLHAAMLTGRCVSLAAVLAIVACIFLGVRRCGVSWLWALPSLALALQWQALWEFCASYRPDAPQVACSMFAVVLLCPPRERLTGRILTLAFAVLWLGFWFKATPIGMLIALLWFVASQRGWRMALRIAVLFAATGLGLFALLNWHWHGLLALNMLAAEQNGFSLSYLKTFSRELFVFQPALAPHLLPFAMVLVALALLWRHRSQPSPASPPLALLYALPLSLVFNLLLTLKSGSDRNYFFEPLALATILLGWLMARAWASLQRRRAPLRELAWLAATAFAAWSALAQARDFPFQFRLIRQLYAPPQRQLLAARTPGPILASNSDLTSVKGRESTIGDRFMYCNLCNSGKLSPQPLFDRINAEAFDMLILFNNGTPPQSPPQNPSPLWQLYYPLPGLWPLINQHYVEAAPFQGFRIWRPRHRAVQSMD